jgi:CheY-like chemotaxis protein
MAFDNHNTQRYIYLADDDSDDRDLFAGAILEVDPDAVLKQAQDGMCLMDDLLALSRAELPDFIFLDINMPCKSGLECLEEIKNQKGDLKQVNVVMLSTSSNPENIQRAMELGAAFYAVKPSSFEKLKSILDEILSMNLASAFGESRKFLLL